MSNDTSHEPIAPIDIPVFPSYSIRRKVCNCDCYKSQIYEHHLKEAYEILQKYPTGQDDGTWIKRRQEFLEKGIEKLIQSYGNPYKGTPL